MAELILSLNSSSLSVLSIKSKAATFVLKGNGHEFRVSGDKDNGRMGVFLTNLFCDLQTFFSSPLISISKKNRWWAPLSVIASSNWLDFPNTSGALHCKNFWRMRSCKTASIRDCWIHSSSNTKSSTKSSSFPLYEYVLFYHKWCLLSHSFKRDLIALLPFLLNKKTLPEESGRACARGIWKYFFNMKRSIKSMLCSNSHFTNSDITIKFYCQ